MKETRIYKTDLYEVIIRNRICKITVEYYNGSNYFICKFINDNLSDFINTYKSFGFHVDKTGETTKFTVAGEFRQEDAMSVWDQIEIKEKPIFSKSISI